MSDIKILGMIDPDSYPPEQRALVEEFNRKLLAITEEHARLTKTVSRKEQEHQQKLNKCVRIYNVNLTRGMIEDEIFQEINGVEYPVLEGMGLPIPCPAELFFRKTAEDYVVDEDRDAYLAFQNVDRLLREFDEGKRDFQTEYTCRTEHKGLVRILHTMLLDRSEETGDVIAMCSSRDVTEARRNSRQLEETQNRLRRNLQVNEVLTGDFQIVILVDTTTLDMTMFRNDLPDIARSAASMMRQSVNYKDIYRRYIERYVSAQDRERVLAEVSPETILDRTKGEKLFYVNYLRIGQDGSERYHQLVFGRSMQGPHSDQIVMAFRDVDEQTRRDMKLGETIREQFRIVDALSREYVNIYKVYLDLRLCEIVKMNGYIFEGVDPSVVRRYDYAAFLEKYTKDRVHTADRTMFRQALDIDSVRKALEDHPEYVVGYRAVIEGQIHYFQAKFVKVEDSFGEMSVIAAFQNVDSIVEAAREREILLERSEQDLMTGVLNRGSGEEKAGLMMKQNRSGLFCIIDVDHFKRTNDTYGHKTGDRVLTHLAGSLKAAFRENDIIFRLGGDEFAVYAANVSSQKDGRRILDRFLNRMSGFDTSLTGGEPISVSVGALILDEQSGADFARLYELADGGLYESKKREGNQVTFVQVD